MKKLPEAFLERMRKIITDETEYEAFLHSYEQEAERGIRLNLRKFFSLDIVDRDAIYTELLDVWGLEPLNDATYVECDGRKYYREFHINEEALEERGIVPGKHPYHEAGLYYMQEPSAMQLGIHLDVRAGDKVIDLCASPGGKSTHVADFLSIAEGGWILSNEYVGNRARTLSSNIERMGVLNAIVTNEDTYKLAIHFPKYFDRVIIDAPCSGEGMFRKDEQALAEWSEENIRVCVERQREIVQNGVNLLAESGTLAYSTCTFEQSENEEMADYIQSLDARLEKVFEKKVFPHKERGEGHYIVIFKRKQEDASKESPLVQVQRLRTGQEIEGRSMITKEKGREVLSLDYLADTSSLRTLRRGVFLSNRDKDRIEPEHGYAHLALSLQEYPVLSLPVEDKRIWDYLKGLEISLEMEELDFPASLDVNTFKKGYVIVAVRGAGLGFGKYVNGRLKNHYPKGLRFRN